MDGPHGENLLFEWVSQGFMTQENQLIRFDKSIKEHVAIDDEEEVQIRQFFEKYGSASGSSKNLCLHEIEFIIGMKDTARPEKAPFLDILHILFRSLLYLSTYPFPPKVKYITSEGMKLALTLLLPSRRRPWDSGRVDAIVGAHNSERARTIWDRRRLLFQSLAKPQPGNDLPFDKQKWKDSASQRSFDHGAGEEFTITNRNGTGDELLHDYVDFMEATQLIPEYGPRARVRRGPFFALANQLHRKNRTLKLKDFVICAGDLTDLVRTMLKLHLDSSGTYFRDHEDELKACTARVTSSFLRGVTGVNWEMFASTLGRTSQYLFDPLMHIATRIIQASPLKHQDLLPSPLGMIFTVPHLSQLSLFLHDDVKAFENYELVYSSNPGDRPDHLDSLVNSMSSSNSQHYSGILLFSAESNDEQPYVFGFWSEHPASNRYATQPPLNSSQSRESTEYQVTSLFQLSPVHDVFPGKIGQPGWQAIDDELVFGHPERGMTIRYRPDLDRVLISHHPVDPKMTNEIGVYAATDWRGDWELELKPDCVEYWRYMVPDGSD